MVKQNGRKKPSETRSLRGRMVFNIMRCLDGTVGDDLAEVAADGVALILAIDGCSGTRVHIVGT